MKIIEFKEPISIQKPFVLCIGFFDGFHLGHQVLIKKAKEFGLPIAIYTFNLSPKQWFLHLEERKFLDDETRNQLLEELGVEYLFIQKVDADFFNLTPLEFIEKYLKTFAPQYLIVGEDYTFGKEAKGNVDLLKQSFSTTVVPLLKDKKGKLSTSRLIEDLNNGDISDLTHVLGRFYHLKGEVVKGYQNGRTIGFKTANMHLACPYFLPKNGVYTALAYVHQKKYMSMINVGVHPTIEPLKHPLIEVHILDFDEDIYLENIEIEIVSFIRDEKKFASLEDLKEQLQKDLVTTRKELKKYF